MHKRKPSTFYDHHDHHEQKYSSSDTSESTSSSENYDTPLRKFNRLLRESVAHHWMFFKRDRLRISLKARGRSVSDAGLCSLVDEDDLDLCLDDTQILHRQSLQFYTKRDGRHFIKITSASGSSSVANVEEASDADGSDVDGPRRGHHYLRVPTPASLGQSTGNFPAGGAGGGCGGHRSAPATPLQLEPLPRPSKHDKHTLKPFSGSAPSVRAPALDSGDEQTQGSKLPSKSRQKKFYRNFPQVPSDERVLNYYSCALVGDLLLQGHLYITKNYFAFYSNVFGYVTKLLIPTTSVLRITKEKVARIIPNAVGVCTREERHVFGSLLSRDATYKLMTHVWKAANTHRDDIQELRNSEVDLDASEYSPEDDSSSAGGDHVDSAISHTRLESENIIPATAAVIQPALLAGTAPVSATGKGFESRQELSSWIWSLLLVVITVTLAISALALSYKLYILTDDRGDLDKLSNEELYNELAKWRSRIQDKTADELHSFLTSNLMLLSKVRQSLQTLSAVILTDVAQQSSTDSNTDVPNDTIFS